MKNVILFSVIALSVGTNIALAESARDSFRMPASSEKMVEGKEIELSPGLSALLMEEIKKQGAIAAAGTQGWYFFEGKVSCADPEGSAEASDKPACKMIFRSPKNGISGR